MKHRGTILISDVEGDGHVDFEDFLISELAGTLRDISSFCHGGALPSVQIGKATVTVHEQDVDCGARERLCWIAIAARRVTEEEPDLNPIDVVVPLLDLDGWSLTSSTLRTPLWLRAVREWPLDRVAEWHEELKCLGISISL